MVLASAQARSFTHHLVQALELRLEAGRRQIPWFIDRA
jgi:hypothetical protein